MNPLKKQFMYLAAAFLLVVVATLYLSNGSPKMGPPGDKGARRPPEKQQSQLPESAQQKRELHDPQARSVNKQSRPPMQIGSKEKTNIPTVGVTPVSPQSYTAKVKGYGEVVPEYALSLSARISGQVEHVNSAFKTGARIKEGETLALLNKTPYIKALATAEAAYQEALVALEEEKLQGLQAKKEWQRSGLDGQPSSKLVLREPYLKAAEAGVKQTFAEKKSAELDLSNAQLTVPFNSIIVSRDIQPGSYVQSGATVATLYSTDIAEISIPLSASQWESLPSISTLDSSPWPVLIEDMEGKQQWHGKVIRIEQHLDTASRQRAAIVTVTAPLDQATPLYFGTYIQAFITGKQWSNVWKIPSSAISQKQEVWWVNKQQTLDKFVPTVLFQDQNFAYITPQVDVQSVNIVTRPLSSYLVGTKVRVELEGQIQ